MTTKLPKLPEPVTTIGPCPFGGEPTEEVQLFAAVQMEAYAREAVAEVAAHNEGLRSEIGILKRILAMYSQPMNGQATSPTGDNAEHVRVLGVLLRWHSGPDLHAALAAAIAALSQPRAEAAEGGRRYGHHGDQIRALQPSVAVTELVEAAKAVQKWADPYAVPGCEKNEVDSARLTAAIDAITQGAANE